MSSNELEKLTGEILELHKQQQDFGRRSVELVIECGKRLSEVKSELPHGKWGDWCFQFQDQISVTTINRYIRLYNRSLVTDLKGLTLDEAYQKAKILNKEKSQKKKPNYPPGPSAADQTQDQSGGGEKRPSSKFLTFLDLLYKLNDIGKHSFAESEIEELLRLLRPIVEWYIVRSQRPLRELPVVEIEINEGMKEAA